MRLLLSLVVALLTAHPSWAAVTDPIADLVAASTRKYSRLALLPVQRPQSAADIERIATEATGVVFAAALARPDGSWEVTAAPRSLSDLRAHAQTLRRSGLVVWAEIEPDQYQSQAKRAAARDELSRVDGIASLIVTAREPSSFHARLAAIGLSVRRQLYGDVWVIALPRLSNYEEAQRAAQSLVDSGIAKHADPDVPISSALTPNDPAFAAGAQWGLSDPSTSPWSGIWVEPVWDLTQGDPNLVVAVVDTGVRPHSEINPRLLQGYTFITNTARSHDGLGWHAGGVDPGDWAAAGECGLGKPAGDSSWHGTHVAGIIGAAGNNGVGTAGINWQSKILPVRVLGTCGGSGSDILTGMLWAAGLPEPHPRSRDQHEPWWPGYLHPSIPGDGKPRTSIGGFGGRCGRERGVASGQPRARVLLGIVHCGRDRAEG